MSAKINGIAISDFVTILLGNGRYMDTCPPYIAEILRAADKEGQYIFVEYPNNVNGLEHLRVWNMRDWKDSYERLVKRRELSELEMAVYNAASVCKKRIAAHLSKLTGLEVDNMLEIASRVLVKHNIDEMLSLSVVQWQINDLLEAEKRLADYKAKVSI